LNNRIIKSFTDGWKFHKLLQADEKIGIEAADFDDREWKTVTLPHTWNDSDGCTGRTGICEGGENYYRGLGGYRKSCCFSGEEYAGKRIFLEFEGANTFTELFVNGIFAGRHEGGFAAFRFDITENIRVDENNLIAVKVSNAPSDYIAPITDQGDFTKMGGIYRDVKLIVVNPIHVNIAKARAEAVDDSVQYYPKCANADCGDTSENADTKGRHIFTDEENEACVTVCPSCGEARREKYKVVWSEEQYDLYMELKSTEGQFEMLFDNCYGFSNEVSNLFQSSEGILDGPVFGDFCYTSLVESKNDVVEGYLNSYRDILAKNSAGETVTSTVEQ